MDNREIRWPGGHGRRSCGAWSRTRRRRQSPGPAATAPRPRRSAPAAAGCTGCSTTRPTRCRTTSSAIRRPSSSRRWARYVNRQFAVQVSKADTHRFTVYHTDFLPGTDQFSPIGASRFNVMYGRLAGWSGPIFVEWTPDQPELAESRRRAVLDDARRRPASAMPAERVVIGPSPYPGATGIEAINNYDNMHRPQPGRSPDLPALADRIGLDGVVSLRMLDETGSESGFDSRSGRAMARSRNSPSDPGPRVGDRGASCRRLSCHVRPRADGRRLRPAPRQPSSGTAPRRRRTPAAMPQPVGLGQPEPDRRREHHVPQVGHRSPAIPGPYRLRQGLRSPGQPGPAPCRNIRTHSKVAEARGRGDLTAADEALAHRRIASALDRLGQFAPVARPIIKRPGSSRPRTRRSGTTRATATTSRGGGTRPSGRSGRR